TGSKTYLLSVDSIPSGKSGLRLAPDLVEKEIARAVSIGFGLRVGIEVHHLILVCRGAGGPLGQTRAVRVAGTGEVGPVLADLVGKFAVLGPPDRLGTGVEGAEDILDIVGVKSADGGGMVFVAG